MKLACKRSRMSVLVSTATQEKYYVILLNNFTNLNTIDKTFGFFSILLRYFIFEGFQRRKFKTS